MGWTWQTELGFQKRRVLLLIVPQWSITVIGEEPRRPESYGPLTPAAIVAVALFGQPLYL